MKSNITGILISSGYSGRMNAFKPLLQYEGVSFVSGILLKLGLVCDEVVVVVGHEHESVKEEIHHCFNRFTSLNKYIDALKTKTKIVYNENYANGMLTSLKKGLQSSGKSDWFLYHFVDQPNLPIKFYKEFTANISNEYNWIQPNYNHSKAHPILFNNKIKELVFKLGKSDSLKNISRTDKAVKKIWECNYKEVLTDIDTPEDYKELLTQSSESLINNLTNH
jgi:molybdenum cofactor cytidylyltransferase